MREFTRLTEFPHFDCIFHDTAAFAAIKKGERGMNLEDPTMQEPFTPDPKATARTLYEWMDAAVVSLVLVVALMTAFFGVVGVDGASMENTLFSGDKLIIIHFFYEPQYGDIVVISRNYENDENMVLNQTNKPLIKRVIATENQQVQIRDGKVWVDGIALEEPYVKNRTERIDLPEEGVTVPEGCVLVMGDNREESHDSRSQDIGMVDTRYILGKVVFRVFPFSRLGVPS